MAQTHLHVQHTYSHVDLLWISPWAMLGKDKMCSKSESKSPSKTFVQGIKSDMTWYVHPYYCTGRVDIMDAQCNILKPWPARTGVEKLIARPWVEKSQESAGQCTHWGLLDCSKFISTWKVNTSLSPKPSIFRTSLTPLCAGITLGIHAKKLVYICLNCFENWTLPSIGGE